MAVVSVQDIDVTRKSVLVRGDLEGELASPRLLAVKQLVMYLKAQGVERVKVIGHQGSIALVDYLDCDVNWDLRVDPREKENSLELAQELAAGFDIYINEAFGTSHRKHTSLDALPRFMHSLDKPVGIGPRFAKEIEFLSTIRANPNEPKVLVVGGTKVEDKTGYADDFAKQGWTVLRGGLLPGADLRADGLDISDTSIASFLSQIAQAKVIVAAGVMGKYEDSGAEKGTKEILTAVAASKAYKIAGGGDIEAAIAKYHLTSKFDWISVGGGVMLEYLTTGSLPGIEALTE